MWLSSFRVRCIPHRTYRTNRIATRTRTCSISIENQRTNPNLPIDTSLFAEQPPPQNHCAHDTWRINTTEQQSRTLIDFAVCRPNSLSFYVWFCRTVVAFFSRLIFSSFFIHWWFVFHPRNWRNLIDVMCETYFVNESTSLVWIYWEEWNKANKIAL